MSIYVNRILNMKQIKVIGFDMDHTLVRYYSDKFEELTFHETIKKLVNNYDYPEDIKKFSFNFNDAIRGLIVDKENGNVLKVSLYNKIKNAYHGTKQMSYKQQKHLYRGMTLDVSNSRFLSVDTTFSIAFTIIYSQMVDYSDKNPEVLGKGYSEIADDILDAVDIAHRDDSLKSIVKSNLSKYIIQDDKVVESLERFVDYGKKLWIITNSGYAYTKALLDYTINPFLKKHKSWEDLFEITITLSRKPSFFTDNNPFLKVDQKTGMLENYDKTIVPGIYQGGNAIKLQEDMKILGTDILYLGDHIYGDILKLKRSCEWRTALVVEELEKEVDSYRSTKNISVIIDDLMERKVQIEREIDELYTKEHEFKEVVKRDEVQKLFKEIEAIDKKVGENIVSYDSHFNSKWGEVMKAGAEPSFFAEQVERYACIYMSKISDFVDHNPRVYFRPHKRKLAHEFK